MEYKQFIVLVFDPTTESDLVFFVHAINHYTARRLIGKYYKEQGWPVDGIAIEVKVLHEGENIQMIGHRYVRGLANLNNQEKVAVLHKD